MATCSKQLLRDFLTEHYVPRRMTLKAHSVEQIEISVRSLEKFFGRPVRLDELTNELICRWLTDRLKRVGRDAVKRNRCNVVGLWREAMRQRKCRRADIEVPTIKVPKKVPRAVPVSDLEKLLSAAAAYQPLRRPKMPACGCWADWWVALLLGIYDSAARIDALLNVRVGDLDLVGLTITLRGETAKTELEQVLPITRQTASAIAKVIRRTDGTARAVSELVFDFPCRRRSIWLKLKALAKSAGVTLLRGQAFHSIRKTNATLTTAYGSVEAASRTLGHSSTAMTWQRYVDPRLLRSLQSGSVNLLPRPVFVSRSDALKHQRCLFG